MVRATRFAILLATLYASGCAVSREGARDRAAAHACDRLQACGNIGSNQLFATRDECEINQRAFWTDVWPVNNCDNRINGDALDFCLQSIDKAACGLSVSLVTMADSCRSANVCSGN